MSKEELANYRIKRAKDTFNQKHYKLSINRSYYAMFTSAKALLSLKGKDSSKHSGVISLFNQFIVKKGLFQKEISKYLPIAKDIREDADYGDFIEITKEDAKIQLDRSEEFIKEAEKTLNKMLKK